MEQSVLAPLQNNVLTSTSDFETFHCFETREKKMMKFLSGCLGYQKYWTPSCIIWGIRISEYFPVFWGIRNSESPVLFGGSEILNHLCCLGIRNSESSPVLFGGSEILNLLCFLAIRISESSPVFLGDQKLWISCVAWGIRNSESSPVFLGNQKFWILSCVVGGVRNSEFMSFRLCSLAIKS